MAFTSLFKKASHLLGFSTHESLRPPPVDGEIIYCKNNVCVHPPVSLGTDTKPIPGYLNVRCQGDEIIGSTLILTWIPNSTLKKNPKTIQNSPGGSPRISPRRTPKQEFATDKGQTTSPSSDSTSEESNGNRSGHCKEIQGVGLTHENTSEGQKSNLSASIKSQTDSGISECGGIVTKSGGATPSAEGDEEKSIKSDEISMSSESESISVEGQMKVLLGKPGSEQRTDLKKERNSSTVSIEMDGDKLVVVTEENVEDSAFIPDTTTSTSQEKGDQNTDAEVEELSLSSDSTRPSPTGEHYKTMLNELTNKSSSQVDKTDELAESDPNNDSKPKKPDLTLDLESHNDAPAPDIITHSPGGSSTTTSGPDSGPASPAFTPESPELSLDHQSQHSTPSLEYPPVLEGNPESFAVSHNLTFPENSVTYTSSPTSPVRSPKTAREQMCGVFSVDLSQMRSLRLFYSDDECTSGQLVIASRESQYKILHFHHGGLDKLADVLDEWNFIREKREQNAKDLHIQQFSVVRPKLPQDECHPEEGVYEMVTPEVWKQHMTEEGQITDDYQLRKAIFFAGLDTSLRHEAWPFLLQYYQFDSSYEEREQIRNDRYIQYQDIRKKREKMTKEEKEQFWRSVQCTVEKDVVRTDRSHPYFSGENNPNIEVLKNILLNYAVENPTLGYTQGMSDLLAPVLAEVQQESDAYWCFVGLMQGTIFFSSPKDRDMDKQLDYLRELLRIMQPKFYRHLMKHKAEELLFCHRWILLCFKREFPEADALRIWESCWAHYQTDYFHLFICLAIIGVYGEDVIQQDLPADEMLLHFSSLAMHMSGKMILGKARGLLHQFRLRPRIPCTLHGLCTLCGTGMWDSGHVPTVKCVGNHPDGICPYQGQADTP